MPRPGDPGSRAPRNRTITLSDLDRRRLGARVLRNINRTDSGALTNRTYHGDSLQLARQLPNGCTDLLILDPPYNLTKDFHGNGFAKKSVELYSEWLSAALEAFKHTLRETASVYICGDWYSSISIYAVASRHLIVRNRITWEREKGRGARTNWKNASEDIWFCTVSDRYTFNVDDVKIRRRVLAPYREKNGAPKDWLESPEGNYRDTCPSNIWTDITVPFWSMPENTDHPTQKSEKLIAKLLLASTKPGDLVLDPFVGSGTSAVVAKKLGRRYLGIDVNLDYCLLTERRLELADGDSAIQGLAKNVFWERNTAPQKDYGLGRPLTGTTQTLFTSEIESVS